MQINIKKEETDFKAVHNYEINWGNPQTYSEKICWRKLHDRRYDLVEPSDKYRVRDYLRRKIGYEADNYLTPLVWVGEEPEKIPFNYLPEEYIIKPNHSAGRWTLKNKVHYEVGIRKAIRDTLSEQEIIKMCKDWLAEDFSIYANEWAYSEIKRLIIIEKILRKPDSTLPDDYRMCMFDGKLRMVYVTGPYQKTFNYYDENWKPYHLKHKKENTELEKPEEFEEMVELAERIATGWDFIRVDFMLADKVYFGEITNYPGGGHTPFPKEIDLKLGKYWRLQ